MATASTTPRPPRGCSTGLPVRGSARSMVASLVWRYLSLTALMSGLMVLTPAAASDTKSLGSFKAWTAVSFVEQKSQSCMLWSQPEKSAGDYQRRGEVFIFVTHRPGEQSFDRITYETGYTYKAGSEVTIEIDGSRFTLAADGSTAWTTSADADRALVRAMRAGRQMIVRGVSSRGTETEDTFSLFGFSRGHGAINQACKRPA